MKCLFGSALLLVLLAGCGKQPLSANKESLIIPLPGSTTTILVPKGP